jgi:excisionase family DNA binding protein
MHPLVLDLEGAAAMIAVSPNTARRWAATGQIPGSRIGGQWRFWTPSLLESAVGADAAAHAQGLPEGYVEPSAVGVAQLADLLGIHQRTIAVLLRQGDIPAKKIGYLWRAYWPEIRDHIAAGLPLGEHAEPEQDRP